MPGQLRPEDLQLRIAVTAAVTHGARFIVADDDTITVHRPERIPPGAKLILRARWPEAKQEILRQEHRLRNAESLRCPACDTELGRFIDHNLWIAGGKIGGWGADNWRCMGQSPQYRRCPSCGDRVDVIYRVVRPAIG